MADTQELTVIARYIGGGPSVITDLKQTPRVGDYIQLPLESELLEVVSVILEPNNEIHALVIPRTYTEMLATSRERAGVSPSYQYDDEE